MRGGFAGRVESQAQNTRLLLASGALAGLIAHTNEGRLTATTGVPVTTADVSGATTIYFTPYTGNRLALYDGALWNLRTFPELAIPLAGFTASLPYDVFASDVAGTVTIDTLAWTSPTARATALVRQHGVLSRGPAGPLTISSVSVANPTVITTSAPHGLTSGALVTISGTSTTPTTSGTFVATVTGASTFTIPVNVTAVATGTGTATLLLTHRYLGSVYINASGGQTDDTLAKRNIFNIANRVTREMRVTEATTSWPYSTATIRLANAPALNQLEFMVGVAEDAVWASVVVGVVNSNAGGGGAIGIGEDSTTVISTKCVRGNMLAVAGTALAQSILHASITVVPAEGVRRLMWLETGNGTATQTWNSNQNNGRAGIHGIWRA